MPELFEMPVKGAPAGQVTIQPLPPTPAEVAKKALDDLLKGLRKNQRLFFTAWEAKDLGYDLQAGWLLKLTGANGVGEPAVSFVSPEKWEIFRDIDLYISPAGERYTREQLTALYEAQPIDYDMPTVGIYPEVDNALRRVFPDLYDVTRYEDGERIIGATFGITEETATQYAWQWISQQITDDPQGLLQLIYDKGDNPDTRALLRMFNAEEFTDATITEFFAPDARFVDIDEKVTALYPHFSGDPAAFMQWADTNREAFIKDLRLQGASREKYDLLQAMGFNWETITDIFRVQELIIEVEGVHKLVTVMQKRLLNPRNPIYNEQGVEIPQYLSVYNVYDKDGIHIGEYNYQTKEFTPYEYRLGDTWKSISAGWGDVIATTGYAFTWLGWDGAGKNLSEFGQFLQAQAPPDTLGEFGWEMLFNPRFYATRAARTMQFTMALVPAMVLGSYAGLALAPAWLTVGASAPVWGATVRAIIGAVGATMLSRPMESAMEAGAAYDEAIRKGLSVVEAKEVADKVFWGNMTLAGLDVAQLAAAFAPSPFRSIAALQKSGLFKFAMIGGKITVIGLSEAGEEAFQENLQRWALAEQPNIFITTLDPEMQEAMAMGFMMGAGMGTAGTIYIAISNRFKQALPTQIQKQFDDLVDGYKRIGKTDREANLLAMDVVGETYPEVLEQIQAVIENVTVDEFQKFAEPKTEAQEIIFNRNMEARRGQSPIIPIDVAETRKVTMPEVAAPVAAEPISETVGGLEKGAWVQFKPDGVMYQITDIGRTRVTLVDGQGNKSTIPLSQAVYPLEPKLPEGAPRRVPDVHYVSEADKQAHIADLEQRQASYERSIAEEPTAEKRAQLDIITRTLEVARAAEVRVPEVAVPHEAVTTYTTYSQAMDKLAGQEKNILIRDTKAKTNKGRVLLVQFSSDLMATMETGTAKEYYDRIYDRVPAYVRADDFWEIPRWIAQVAKTFNRSDVYIIRDMKDAEQFLSTSDYGALMFSAMEVNVDMIKQLAKKFPNRVYVGGYVTAGRFRGIKNLKYIETVQQLAKELGVEYKEGLDYRHFKDTEAIPRLCMSTGCLHGCLFCTVKDVVRTVDKSVIDQDISQIVKNLQSPLIYLDDKTFGQAPNYTYLEDIYKRIAKARPDFKGFVIQTTAGQLMRLSDQFLKRAGIQYVELGIESFNNEVLRRVKKPHTEELILHATAKLRRTNISLVPNIMIGLEGETAATYKHTLDYLRDNADIISHINAYNLALYEGTEMRKLLGVKSAADVSEGAVEKSWYKVTKVHQKFAKELFALASEIIGEGVTFQNATPRAFTTAIAKSTKGVFLTKFKRSELSAFTLKLTEAGDVGYGITADNEVVNLFNASGIRGAGEEAMIEALTLGADKLNCYEYLVNYYESLGFKEISRAAWNDKQAPKGWSYQRYGRPDIVYMEYPEGGTRDANDIRRSVRAARGERLARQPRRIGTVEAMGFPVGRRKRRGIRAQIPTPYPRPVGELTGSLRDELGEIRADIEVLTARLKGKVDATSRMTSLLLTGTRREIRIAESLLSRIEAGEVITADELTTARDRLTETVKLHRAKLQTIADYKTALVNYANTLPLNVRGKLLAAVKNVATQRQLNEAVDMAANYAEQNEQRYLREQINKEVRKTKPIKRAGIVVGRYTPEVQAQLDFIRDNVNKDRDEVRTQIANNIRIMDDWESVAETKRIDIDTLVEQNELLSLSGIKGMSSEELQVSLDAIKEIKQYGRTLRQERRAAEKERIAAIRSDISGVLTGGAGLKAGRGTVDPRTLEINKGWFEKLVNWQYSWQNFMDKLSKLDKTSKPYRSALNRFSNRIFDARSTENVGLKLQFLELRENFQRIYGVTRRRDMNHLLNRMQQEELHLGKFTNVRGEVVELKLTKDQIISKYQQLLDPTLDATFRNESEGAMAWTDEMMAAINNGLTTQDKAWADWQMQYYQRYYDSINEVYRSVYGIDLPRNQNYTPLKRDVEGDVPENVLTYQDLAHYASVLNGSLISRINSKIPLRFNGSTELLMQHIGQMEHFKAWAQTMRDMRRIFGNKEIRTAIRQYHGAPILKIIDNYLNDMARGGIQKARINRGADFLRRNFTRSILGLKPAIALKQIPSVIAYTTEMPIRDFVTGIADFWSDPIANYRQLMQMSTYIQTRFGQGFERDIQFAMRTTNIQKLSGSTNISDVFLMLIRMGDRLAVTQGIWAKYQSALKEGMSKPEAIAEAERATQRTQPTFSLETLSPLQNGGSWVKLLTMFQNQPNKYFRIIADNCRNLQYGRGSRAKAITNIATVWIILPILFQFIADGLQWKKEHQLRAILLGQLNWLLIFSQMARSVYDWAFSQGFTYQASPVLQTGREIQNLVTDLVNMWKAGQDPTQDITIDDVIEVVEGIAKTVGQLTGIPTPWLVQAERAVRQGQPLELVFSRWSLKPPKKDDHTKSLDESANLGKTELDVRLMSDDVETRIRAEKELKEREKAIEEGLTVEPLGLYDMGDYDTFMRRNYSSVLPSTIVSDEDASAWARSWAEMEMLRVEADLLPDRQLYKINTDEDEDTIIEYRRQWLAREGITSLAKLKEFDSLYPDAVLGNVTPEQFKLLKKYLRADDKGAFLTDLKVNDPTAHELLMSNPRNEWLKEHPEENARLAIWGRAKILSKEAYAFAIDMIDELGIPDNAVIDKSIPPEFALEGYFNYIEATENHGAQSWEVNLIMAENPDLRDFLGRELSETPVEALELLVKDRLIYDMEADIKENLISIPEKTSPNYKDGREYALEQLRLKYPEWVDNQRRIEAIRVGTLDEPTPAEIAESWAKRGNVIDEHGAGSAEAKLWLVDNIDTYRWAIENEVLEGTGGLPEFKDERGAWNIPALRIDAKWTKEDKEYDEVDPDAINPETGISLRDEYLAEHDAYRRDRYRRTGYQRTGAQGEKLTDLQVEQYMEYMEMPDKGKGRERMLVEDEVFGEAMHTVFGIDIPDRVPAVEYDEIYEQHIASFEKMEGYANYKSQWYIQDADEREAAYYALRFNEAGDLTPFGRAEIRRNGYYNYVPEEFIDQYTEYYSMVAKGKPYEMKDMEVVLDDEGKPVKVKRWYDDDWYLMENQDFYTKVYLGVLGKERADFRLVPTREVFALWEQYVTLAKGSARKMFRRLNPELDEWMVLTGQVSKTVAEQDAADKTEPTTWDEEYAQMLQDLIDKALLSRRELDELQERMEELMK